MALAQYDQDKMNESRFPIFDQAGTWGANCGQLEADCSIADYYFPAPEDPLYDVLADDGSGLNTRGKGYRGPYARFDLRCERVGQQAISERWYVQQNEAFITLGNLGVVVDDDGSHDTDDVVGKTILIETLEPRTNDAGRSFSKIKRVTSG